jgi:hypothetical protein
MLIEELKGRLVKMWWDIVKVVAQQKQQWKPGQKIEMQPAPLPQTQTRVNPKQNVIQPIQPSAQQTPQQQLIPQQVTQQTLPKATSQTVSPTIQPGEPGYYEALQPAQSANVQSTVGTTAAKVGDPATDVAAQDPKAQVQATKQSMMRAATGQHSDLSTRITNISAMARTNTGMQKKLLGRIRFLLREANIPEVKVATGLPGDIQ